MQKFQAIKGVRDILPPDSGLWNRVEKTAREVFGTYGYGEIRLPILEPTDLFARAVGAETDVVSKEMYSFQDRDDSSISLRPEATASVVRLILSMECRRGWQCEALLHWSYVFGVSGRKRGATGSFIRLARSCLGRRITRRWMPSSLRCCWHFLSALVWWGARLQVNSIGDKNCRPAYVAVLRAALEKVRERLGPDSQRRIETNPLRVLDSKSPEEQAIIAELPHIADHLCAECAAHYAQLKQELALRGVAYEEKLRLVRGLDYYMRTTFEITATGLVRRTRCAAAGATTGWWSCWAVRRPRESDLRLARTD